MRTLLRNLCIGLIAVGMSAGIALADNHEGAEPPPPGAEASGEYPQEIIARPLTLVTGMWEAAAFAATNEGFDFFGVQVAGNYGVSDKLTVGVSYAFTLDPSEFKGPFVANALFSFLTDDKMEAVATGSLGYDLLAEGITPLNAGVLVQYNLNDKMAVIAGGNQLTITLEGDVKPIFLSLPVSFGYQVDNQIYAEVGTNIGTIEIADADTTFIFADNIPVTAAGFFSPDNKMDIGLTLSTELKDNAFDPLFIGVLARYRGGM